MAVLIDSRVTLATPCFLTALLNFSKGLETSKRLSWVGELRNVYKAGRVTMALT